jgi:hypothetical protein
MFLDESLEICFEILGRWEGDKKDAKKLPPFEDTLPLVNVNSYSMY